MEVDTRPYIGDDRVSDCRSLGSNYLPTSQSRKVSIGILIDSLAKERSGAAKEDEVAVPDAERGNSKKLSSAEGQNRSKGGTYADKGKQTESSEQVPSPWITARSFQRKAPASDVAVFLVKETSNLPGTSGRRSRPSRGKNVAAKCFVELNQTPNSHSDDGKQRFGGLTYKRKGSKDGNSPRVEEFTFTTPPEVHVSDKAVTDDKTEDRRTEALKMKLREILGTVSSPKSQRSKSQVCETGPKKLNQEQICDQKSEAVLKPRQNSDTIETDSESPHITKKKPVTRSLTRKGASDKRQPGRTKAGPSSSHRRKLLGKNIFSFEDGLFKKGDKIATDGSSMSTRTKVQISSIEPCKISLTEKNKASENQGATHRNETSLPAEKTTSLGNKMGSFFGDPLTHRSETPLPSEKTSSPSKMGRSRGCPPKNNRECLEQENQNQERDSCQCLGRHSHKTSGRNSHKTSGRNSRRSSGRDSHEALGSASHLSPITHRDDEQRNVGTPAVPENMDQQEDFCNLSSKNAVDQNGFRSPTFKVNTSTESASPSSTPKTDQIKQVVCSPAVRGRNFTVGNIWSFENLQTSEVYHASNAQTKSPDFEVEPVDSPASKISPMKGKKDIEDVPSESSSEDGDPESSEEGSPITDGCREAETFSPLIATAETSKFMLHSTKRLRNHEGKKVSRFSPTPPSPKGVGETDWIPKPSEQNQEDELERVIMLFASALDNFKNKMESATRKKSSEIMMSVSDEIQLKLQNIEKQIQTDLGKLKSTSKMKRKHLETRFQEQQEQLKLIHDKFKQDIYQHLENCKSTLEGLEVHQTELKGTVKKQKASHQKLVMQVEETVEEQLNDAERRITAVHKLAREKMLQLRHVITECLSEGILN